MNGGQNGAPPPPKRPRLTPMEKLVREQEKLRKAAQREADKLRKAMERNAAEKARNNARAAKAVAQRMAEVQKERERQAAQKARNNARAAKEAEKQQLAAAKAAARAAKEAERQRLANNKNRARAAARAAKDQAIQNARNLQAMMNAMVRQAENNERSRLRNSTNAKFRESRPPAQSPDFQTWMKAMFDSAVLPTLIQNMRGVPRGKTPYSALSNLTLPGAAAAAACTDRGNPQTSSIQAHQAVVYAMAQMRAAGTIDTSGLLVLQSTGAGKTLVGVCVMLAFWNKTTPDGKPYPILLVSTNDNQSDNDARKLAGYAMAFFPGFRDEAKGTYPFAKPPGSSNKYWENADVIKGAADAISHRLHSGIMTLMRGGKSTQDNRRLYTYAQLGNDLTNGYISTAVKHAVFIVDEIQYLIAPPTTEQSFAAQYRAVFQMLSTQRDPATTWVVGMTATPGETKPEIVSIMNAVMGPIADTMYPTDSTNVLARKARGYVSYAYLLGDRTRFASVRMRMVCSYLQGSYYHDPYYRQLYRLYSSHPDIPPAARAFMESKELQFRRVWGGLKPGKASVKVPHKFRYTEGKTDSYLQPLKAMTLYIPMFDKDMEHLRKRIQEDDNYALDGNNNNNRRVSIKHEWPVQEIFVSSQPKRRGTQTPPNDNSNNDNALGNNTGYALNDNYVARQRTTAGFQQGVRASARVRAGQPPPTQKTFRFLLSPKIPQLLSLVYSDLTSSTKASKGIHFVYTSDSRTALLIAEALTKVLDRPQLFDAQRADTSVGPYYVMIDDVKSDIAMLGAHRTPAAAIPGLKALVSSDQNKYGDIVKVVIATKKSFKGVDLRNVRYLHLMDPLVNFRDFVQFVGRGPRYCSHASLPPSQRFVEVILYRLMDSPDATGCRGSAALPDCFLFDESLKRYTQPDGYKSVEDEVLWKSSVDYLIFKDNLSTSRDALQGMLGRLKCNAVKPVYENPAAANDSNSQKPRSEGFQQLASQVYKFRKDQIKKRLQSQYPPAATAQLKAKALAKALKNAGNNAAKIQEARSKYVQAVKYQEYKAKERQYEEGMKQLQNVMASVDQRARNIRAQANQGVNVRNAANAVIAQHRQTVEAIKAIQNGVQQLRADYADEYARNKYKEQHKREHAALRQKINVVANTITRVNSNTN